MQPSYTVSIGILPLYASVDIAFLLLSGAAHYHHIDNNNNPFGAGGLLKTTLHYLLPQ